MVIRVGGNRRGKSGRDRRLGVGLEGVWCLCCQCCHCVCANHMQQSGSSSGEIKTGQTSLVGHFTDQLYRFGC